MCAGETLRRNSDSPIKLKYIPENDVKKNPTGWNSSLQWLMTIQFIFIKKSPFWYPQNIIIRLCHWEEVGRPCNF